MPLNDSRLQAAALLENPDATRDELRAAALSLGNDLVQAVGDEELWNRLTARPDNVDAATWNHLLRNITDIPWGQILESTGYQPPPEISEVVTQFREGLTYAGGNREDVDVRHQVRELGENLVAVAKDPDSTARNLRWWIRKGIRVAIPVVAGAALTIALQPVVVAIAGAAVSAAAVSASFPVATIVAELVMQCVNGATDKAIRYALDRIWPEDL